MLDADSVDIANALPCNVTVDKNNGYRANASGSSWGIGSTIGLSVAINKIDLPDFETVKGQIQVRNHYLEDNEPEPDENDVITTEKLLGGKFNDKGFLRT